MRALKLPVLLMVLALIVSACFHVAAFRTTDYAPYLALSDSARIIDGYRATPNLMSGGLRWWRGPWINTGNECFRPVSSYAHWSQCAAGFRFGWHWVTLGAWLLFSLVACEFGMLSKRLTGSSAIAIGVTLVFATLQYGFDNGLDFLAWFPVVDNLLCLAFLLSALCMWDRWLKDGKRANIVGAWVLFVTSALCKEYGYVFPLMAGAMMFYGPRHNERAKWAQVAGLAAFTVTLYVYRSHVLHIAHDGYAPGWSTVYARNWWSYNAVAGQRWAVALPVLCAAVAAFLTRYTGYMASAARIGSAACGLALIGGFVWLFSPHDDGPRGEFAIGFLLDNAYPMARDGLIMALVCAGVVGLWKSRRPSRGLTVAAVSSLSLAPLLGFGGSHHALYYRPFLAILAGYALVEMAALVLNRVRQSPPVESAATGALMSRRSSLTSGVTATPICRKAS